MSLYLKFFNLRQRFHALFWQGQRVELSLPQQSEQLGSTNSSNPSDTTGVHCGKTNTEASDQSGAQHHRKRIGKFSIAKSRSTSAPRADTFNCNQELVMHQFHIDGSQAAEKLLDELQPESGSDAGAVAAAKTAPTSVVKTTTKGKQ